MSKLLEGKRVLVTNAGRYMGPPIVEVFEQEGAEVIANTDDLSDPDAADEAVAGAGHVDVLVANLLERKWWEALVQEIPDDDWLKHFDDIVHPLMRLTRAVLPQMIERKSGAIINVSSMLAEAVYPGMVSYSVSKIALEKLTEYTGMELKDYGIAVNALRIELMIASEGWLYRNPGADLSQWEQPEAASEASLWMAAQPPDWTGNVVTIGDVREKLAGR